MYQKSSIQRALVLQGGGALGAYEAGVFAALSDEFQQQDDVMMIIANHYLTLWLAPP
jgi:predicted acylesterase/phospholipase RssA